MRCFLPIFPLSLGYLKLARSSEQLQQVMRHTNQQPFRFGLFQAPQQKLPKAADMFDLRKDRLDDHFSFSEHPAACWASQFMPHPLLNSGVWWQGFCAADRLTLIWWYVQINSSYCLMGKRGFAVVARVGPGPLR